MKEYFISYCISYTSNGFVKPHCRCSIGELTNEEVTFFKKKIGFPVKQRATQCFDLDGYVLHGIFLETIDERYEHNQLLKQFEKENIRWLYGNLSGWLRKIKTRDSSSKSTPPPYIFQLREFIQIAEEIRALRPPLSEDNVKPIDALPPVIDDADYPRQIQAATGRGIPDVIYGENADIEARTVHRLTSGTTVLLRR